MSTAASRRAAEFPSGGSLLAASPGGSSPEVRAVDDLHLMSRLRDDDTTALDELIGRYWNVVVAYASQIVGDRDSAYDIAQEVFIRLWRRRNRWDARGSVRVWLFRTARNLAISEHRKRQVRARWNGEVASLRTPLEDAEDEELRNAIMAALDQMSARRREAFTLFFLRGFSYREVADVMSIQPQSVANHLQAAVAELRSKLGPFFPRLSVPEPTAPSAHAGETGASPSHRPDQR